MLGIGLVSGGRGEDREHKSGYPPNDSNPSASTLLACKLDRRLRQLLLAPDLHPPRRLPLLFLSPLERKARLDVTVLRRAEIVSAPSEPVPRLSQHAAAQ